MSDPLRERLQRGERLVSGWLHFPSPFAAEVMARAGWDTLTLDFQHGMFGFDTALSMIQAVQTTDTPIIARIPSGDLALAMKCLDAGVEGIIAPMIETSEDCAALVSACRYPPIGTRSLGPTRSILRSGPLTPQQANTRVAVLPMIETARALENLEAIAAVPGVDGLFVGPGDLGLSLYGESRLDADDPAFLSILSRVADSASAHGIAAGLFTLNPTYARTAIALGYRLVAVSSDVRLLSGAARSTVDAVKADA